MRNLHPRTTLRPRARRHQAVAALLATVVALALTACGSSGDGDGDKKGLTKLGFQTSFLFNAWDAPFFLALDKGYYEDEGLDVEIREGSGSGAAIQSLLGGLNDIVEAERASMSIQASEHEGLVSVAGLKESNGLAIVSFKDKGIASPADLRGKTVGITLGSSESGILPAFLKQNGVPADKVKIENIGAAQKAQFLTSKKVDAISFVDYSAVSISPLDNLNMITFTDHGLTLLGTGLISTSKFAQEHPEQVRGFIRATMKAFNEAIADPGPALDALMKRTKVLKREAAETQWKMYVEGAPSPFTGKQSTESWSAMLESLTGAGVIKTPRAPEDYFDNQFVE
ncbi:MAG: ABC transporter substrate-binding protein [Nocardioidaceae bacterium]|nr:ABC transporter substrate-binding protein [Nocardioidaceae bacterium]